MTLIIQFATDGKLVAWSNAIMYSCLSSAKKDLEVTVNARVNMSQEHAAIAEGCTMGYVMRSADITGTTYPPLLGTAEAASGIWHPVLGPSSQMWRNSGRPSRQQPRWSGPTASDLWKAVEGVGLARSCRKEPDRWSNSSLQLLEGKLQRWWSQTLLGSARWHNKGQWPQIVAWKFDWTPSLEANAAWTRLPRKVVEPHPWIFPRPG